VLHLVKKTIAVVNLESGSKHPESVQAMHLCGSEIDM
jgi:hypothetical protein